MFYTQTSRVIPIEAENCVKYSGIAFDGTNFFFTLPQKCSIDIFDNNLKFIRRVKTCHAYSAISYDEAENAFLAVSFNEWGRIYKLSKNLAETDYIYVGGPINFCSMLTGVSVNETNNTLLVSFANTIIETDKNGEYIKTLKTVESGTIGGVLALENEFLYTYSCGFAQMVYVYSLNGTFKMQLTLPEGIVGGDMALYLKTEEINLTSIFVLGAKKCTYSCLVAINFINNDFINSITEFSPAPQSTKLVERANLKIEYLIKLEEYIGRILLAESAKIKNISTDESDWQELLKLIDNFSSLEDILDKKLKLLKDIEIKK